ncbi:hypothetical protein N8913_05525 [Litoricola sp.]|nr:hypothetical protein [Litorivicinus sp.]
MKKVTHEQIIKHMENDVAVQTVLNAVRELNDNTFYGNTWDLLYKSAQHSLQNPHDEVALKLTSNYQARVIDLHKVLMTHSGVSL